MATYNEYYDYCEDCDRKSKADEIIDDAKNKLVDLIWEQVKGELEVTQKENELLAKKNAQLQKENFELIEKEKVLQIDNERLKAEMERQDNLVPRTPFAIGEQVHYLRRWGTDEIKCPVCNGKGVTTIKTEQFGEMAITCPNCKGRGSAEYTEYTDSTAWVVGVEITKKIGEKKPKITYFLSYSTYKPEKISNDYFRWEQVYKTTDEVKNEKVKINQKAKEEAEIKMGIKKVEEEAEEQAKAKADEVTE